MRRKLSNLALALPWVGVLWAAPAALFALLLLGSLFSGAGELIDNTTAVPATWRVTFRPGFLDVYRLGAAVPSTAIPLFGRLNSAGTADGVWLGESRIVFRFVGISQLDGHFARGGPRAVPFTRRTLSLRTACLLSCVLALPAAAGLRRHRRRRRTPSAPVCDVCGYDLRATPDRCPECGAVPAAVSGAAA